MDSHYQESRESEKVHSHFAAHSPTASPEAGRNDRAAQAAADQIGEAVADAVADGLIGDVEEDSRTLPVSEYEEVEGVDEPADQE